MIWSAKFMCTIRLPKKSENDIFQLSYYVNKYNCNDLSNM